MEKTTKTEKSLWLQLLGIIFFIGIGLLFVGVEYRGDGKPGSKKIAIGYAMLCVLLGAGILLFLIGREQIDPLISDLFYSLDARSFFLAMSCLLLYTVPGIISWFLGRSEYKKGHQSGLKLMRVSIVFTIMLVASILIRGFYENM
jgi:hypothetical protein